VIAIEGVTIHMTRRLILRIEFLIVGLLSGTQFDTLRAHRPIVNPRELTNLGEIDGSGRGRDKLGEVGVADRNPAILFKGRKLRYRRLPGPAPRHRDDRLRERALLEADISTLQRT
jgi:hypothetical protein